MCTNYVSKQVMRHMTFYKAFGCWLQVFTLKTCVITLLPI